VQPYTAGLLDPSREIMSFSIPFVRYIFTYLLSAHAHRHTQPSSHILILSNWQHSPYLAHNLHSSYTQKLTSIPYLQAQTAQKHTHNTRLNIYLVANEKALLLLNHDYITHALHETLSNLLGRDTQPITLNLNLNDSTYLDSS